MIDFLMTLWFRWKLWRITRKHFRRSRVPVDIRGGSIKVINEVEWSE